MTLQTRFVRFVTAVGLAVAAQTVFAHWPPVDEVTVSETSVACSRALPAAPLANWEAEATGLARDAEYRRKETGTFVSPAMHVQEWSIEGGGPNSLSRNGWRPTTFKPGDAVSIRVNPMRDGSLGGLFVGAKLADGKTIGGGY